MHNLKPNCMGHLIAHHQDNIPPKKQKIKIKETTLTLLHVFSLSHTKCQFRNLSVDNDGLIFSQHSKSNLNFL